MSDKKVLTTFEAAALCNVSYNTIKNWIKRGLLGAYRTAGGHLRIKLEDLEGFSGEYGVPIGALNSGGKRKVMIVGDAVLHDEFQNSFSYCRDKLDVRKASDPFDAGSMLESIKPDLVVMDYQTAGLDLHKVIGYIRRSPSLKHAKVVIVVEEKNDAIEKLPVDHILTRPIDRVTMVESLEQYLTPKRGVRGKNRKKA
jgi:excisionase family DNA binding protein